MEKERALQENVSAPPILRLGIEPLVLASASPRRAEILRAVGWPFEVAPAEIDETVRPGERAEDYVERLAREKAEAVARTRLLGLTLGADTTVVVAGGEMLGKPRDADDARRMLGLLSGRWHEVLTGLALVRAEDAERQRRVTHARSRVHFREMTGAEIDWYVSTGEPTDKAGAYAIQGRGALFIDRIEGDYWNIVGLPVSLVYRLMKELQTADDA
ncbi:MAG: Maf family protein [Pyrinomonadaceae bacterium]